MLIYVAHQYGGNQENFERAKSIVHDLQIMHKEDCFVCPLMAFSHIKYGEIGFDEEMEMCIDLLSACDKLLVTSPISKGVQMEIEYAELFGLEVEFLETP